MGKMLRCNLAVQSSAELYNTKGGNGGESETNDCNGPPLTFSLQDHFLRIKLEQN